MVHETLAASIAPASTSRGIAVGTLLAEVGLGALALYFGWSDPGGHAWASGALLAALCLDRLGRTAGRIVLGGVPAPSDVALPSIVLAPERGLVAAAFLFAAALAVWQDGFAVLASLLAGLLTMGGIARLAIARVVMAVETGADESD